MDRFIDFVLISNLRHIQHLKSSMDRFIEIKHISEALRLCHLKSSMDRFIAQQGKNFPAPYII